MANFNFNKVILGGRLTADPELRQTPTGISVTSFTIAVSRRTSKAAEGQEQPTADFINCVAWRATAEFITKFFKKGSSICVTGSIQTRSWTDQQGQKRYSTDVLVDEAHFVDSKNDSSAHGGAYTPDNYGAQSFSNTASEQPKFDDMSNEDDLPF